MNFSAQVEPLHYLIEADAVQISVKGLRHRGADQLAAYVVGAFHFAFVFQFELAGDGGQGGIDVADAGDN